MWKCTSSWNWVPRSPLGLQGLVPAVGVLQQGGLPENIAQKFIVDFKLRKMWYGVLYEEFRPSFTQYQ